MYSEKLLKICKAINSFYGQKTYYTDYKRPSVKYYVDDSNIWINTPHNSYSISWNSYKNGNYIEIFNARTILTYRFKKQHLYEDILDALCYVFKLCEFEYNMKIPVKGYRHYIIN